MISDIFMYMENTNQTQENIEKENVADKNEKAMSAISYVPFLFIIALLVVQQRSPFVKFHINQGIILTIIFAFGLFIASLLPFVDSTVIDIWKLITMIYVIIGIIGVYNSKQKQLPLIGKLFSFIK